MRGKVGNWTLAADSGLLLYLRAFSKRTTERIADMTTQMDDLVTESKRTETIVGRLHNCFNDFLMFFFLFFFMESPWSQSLYGTTNPTQKLMHVIICSLSSVQFVENRVYDFEETKDGNTASGTAEENGKPEEAAADKGGESQPKEEKTREQCCIIMYAIL